MTIKPRPAILFMTEGLALFLVARETVHFMFGDVVPLSYYMDNIGSLCYYDKALNQMGLIDSGSCVESYDITTFEELQTDNTKVL